MAGKFFVRFNLHNSLCSYPASFDLLRPFVDISDGELRGYFEEIELIHKQRAQRLKANTIHIEALKGKKVLFLGDSLTSDNFGYRRTVTCASELDAHDGSVSGGTSSAVLHSAKMLIESVKPDIVSIMLGTNDSVCIEQLDFPQVSIDEYTRNIDAILGFAKKQGAIVLLFEIPPIIEERFSRSFASEFKLQTNENIHVFNRALTRTASKYGIKPIDNSDFKDASLFEHDGIHLNLKGQELFSKKWLTSCINLIKC